MVQNFPTHISGVSAGMSGMAETLPPCDFPSSRKLDGISSHGGLKVPKGQKRELQAFLRSNLGIPVTSPPQHHFHSILLVKVNHKVSSHNGGVKQTPSLDGNCCKTTLQMGMHTDMVGICDH